MSDPVSRLTLLRPHRAQIGDWRATIVSNFLRTALLSRLRSLRNVAQDDPVAAVGGLVASLLSMAGIVQTVEWALSTTYPYVVLVLLGIGAIALGVLYLRRPSTSRLFEVTRLGRTVSLGQIHTLTIGLNGSARLEIAKKLLFLQEPEASDYQTKVLYPAEFDFDAIDFKSDDATVTRWERQSEGLMMVEYLPHNPASVLEPWDFAFSVKDPDGAGPDFWHFRVPIPIQMREARVIVKTELRIEKVVAFREPTWLARRSQARRARYALRLRNSDAPPAHDFSPEGFEWSIEHPRVGDVYCCTFFLEGGRERTLNTGFPAAALQRWFERRG